MGGIAPSAPPDTEDTNMTNLKELNEIGDAEAFWAILEEVSATMKLRVEAWSDLSQQNKIALGRALEKWRKLTNEWDEIADAV